VVISNGYLVFLNPLCCVCGRHTLSSHAVLCCAVLPQSQVGTVVRTGEDEDPIAVMTVLNTQQHKQAGYMQQIKAHMMDNCKDAAVKQQISKVGCDTVGCNNGGGGGWR
jgi:hypothetical protein